MKRSILVIALGALVLSGERSASAADLSASAGRAAINVQMIRARVDVRRASRRVVVRRTIGMPCMLPPHIIVQKNWNGPQCRWVDNVIPGDLRVRRRYRIAIR